MALPQLRKIKQKRYFNANGKRCRKTTPGAIPKTVELAEWYADIKPTESARERIERRKAGRPALKPKRVKLCSDKRAAQEMLRALIDAEARRAAGLVDYQTQSNQPLGPIVDDYQRYQLSKGNTREYVEVTIARVIAVCDGCQFLRLVDLDANAAAHWLYQQRQTETKIDTPSPRGTATTYKKIATSFNVDTRTVGYWRRKGAPIISRGKNDLAEIARWRSAYVDEKSSMGAGTSNHYVTALRGFGKWLVKHARRCDTNPFENLEKIDARGDVRKDRRVLPSPEFAALIASATNNAEMFRDLSGADRAMIYTLAAYTGLRASEIGSLKTTAFDLTASNPTVTVRPAYTKNSELAVLPLRSDLAARLQMYIGSRQPATLSLNQKPAPVWPSNWSEVGAEMIRVDLAAAGIPYTDYDGRDYDFHALRHQFITGLAEAGVHPKKAQALARHSKIDLTMDHYTKINIHDAAADVERLGAIPTGRHPESALATGTEDARAIPADNHKRTLPTEKSTDSNSLATSLATSVLLKGVILSDKAEYGENSVSDRNIKKPRKNKVLRGFRRLPR